MSVSEKKKIGSAKNRSEAPRTPVAVATFRSHNLTEAEALEQVALMANGLRVIGERVTVPGVARGAFVDRLITGSYELLELVKEWAAAEGAGGLRAERGSAESAQSATRMDDPRLRPEFYRAVRPEPWIVRESRCGCGDVAQPGGNLCTSCGVGLLR